MPDIFFSYAREDRERVAPLVALLEEQGWDIWWDRELLPGVSYERAIDQALTEARVIIVAWSEHSVGSEWVQAEAGEGLDRGVLVPIMLDPVRVPISFRRKHAASLVEWPERHDEKELQTLLQSVRNVLEGKGIWSGPQVAEAGAHYAARPQSSKVSWALGAVVVMLALSAVLLLRDSDVDTLSEILETRDMLLVMPARQDQVVSSQVSQVGIEIGRSLNGLTSLHVVYGDSVERLPEEAEERQVGQRLGADFILTSSIEPDASLRITLSRIDDGKILWQDSYSTQTTHLQRIPSAVARQVSEALDVKTLERPTDSSNVSTEAYLAYLGGRAELRKPTIANEEVRARAISSFQVAIGKEPRFVDAYAGMCEAQIAEYEATHEESAYAEAEKFCNRALTLDPQNSDVLVALGVLYRTSGLYEQAITSHQRALALKSFDPVVMSQLAQDYTEMGEVDEAESLLKTVIQLEPTFWRNYRLLGSLYYRAGRYQEAAEQYELEAELNPDKGSVMLNLGAANFLSGDFEGAIEAWRVSAAIDADAAAFSNLGAAEFFTADFGQAAAMYERSIEMLPKNHIFWGNAAEAYYFAAADNYRDYYRTALELVDQQLMINPDDVGHLSARALYLAGLGSEDEAIEAIKVVLATQGDNLYSWYDAARLYSRLDRTAEARNALARAYALGYPRQLGMADANFKDFADEIEESTQ